MKRRLQQGWAKWYRQGKDKTIRRSQGRHKDKTIFMSRSRRWSRKGELKLYWRDKVTNRRQPQQVDDTRRKLLRWVVENQPWRIEG